MKRVCPGASAQTAAPFQGGGGGGVRLLLMLPLRPAVSTCCCAGAEPSPGRLDSGWDDPASSPPYERTRYRRKQTGDVTLAPALLASGLTGITLSSAHDGFMRKIGFNRFINKQKKAPPI